MLTYLGDFRLGQTIYYTFATYGGSSESITLTGLAASDVEVYKLPSMTQRSSDAGFTLLDTDGIDLDSRTGIHGFSIDTSDNTDAGFYARYNEYCVVVDAVTVNAQTCRFVFGFSIENRHTALCTAVGTLSGTHSTTTADLGTNAPGVDISGSVLHFPGHKISVYVDSYATGTGVATFSPAVAITLANGDNWELHATPKASTANPVPASVDSTQLAKFFSVNSGETYGDAVAGSVVAEIVDNAGGSALTEAGIAGAVWNKLQADHVTAGTFGILATEIADILVDTAVIGATGGGLTSLATQASVNTIDDFLDTEIGTIVTAVGTTIPAAIAAVQADTDNIQTRIPAALNNGVMPADVQRVNDVEIVGDGNATPWGPA